MLSEAEELWEWRQKIANLYHDVRASLDVAAAWRHWCETRALLFRTHPQSPIEPVDRAAFEGPAMFPYDPRLRRVVRLDTVAAERLTVATGADGETAMHSFGRTDGLRVAWAAS